MMADLKFALRQLAKTPGFTAVALVTLALGIGANTAIFSVINGVLLRPLPYAQPDRLMNVWESSQTQNFPQASLPPGNFFDLRAQNQSFVALAGWDTESFAFSAEGIAAVRLDGASVTEDLLAVFRIAPLRGRFFAADEFTPGRDGVVVLSYASWQQQFAGDPALVGRTLQLSGRARTVVGILPEGFQHPTLGDVLVPFAPNAEERARRDLHRLHVAGRLRDGVSYEQARADLQRIHRQIAAQFPDTTRHWTVSANPMLEDFVSKIRPTLLVLLAAVAVVLLIACANVTNLLLARAAGRRQEIAVRLSLGATRGRIARQLLSEAVLLFALGGAVGLVIASWLLDALLTLAPAGNSGLPRADRVTIDTSVLLFTSAVALGTGLVFGLIPAWQNSSADLNSELRSGGRGATAGRGTLRSALIVLQVAAAVMLLVVAGLLLRSFEQVRRVNLGYNPENLLTFHLDLPPDRFADAESRARFVKTVIDSAVALPGVQSVGAITTLSFGGGPSYIMRIAGRPPVTPSNAPVVQHRVVSTDFFRTMAMTLVRGRGFTAADAPGSPRVCVINQTFAQKFFPHEDPLGQRVEIGFDDPPAWREIVGIVGDVKADGLDRDTPAQVFEPLHQFPVNNYTFAVRTVASPAQLAPAIRAALEKIDRTQPIHSIKPMTLLLSESLQQRTFSLVLLGVFAAVALVLAGLGLYGVISYNVAQRTREFGVRIAIGAGPREILRLVLGSGSRLIAAGLVLGLLGAALGTRVIQSLLFGVSAHDPLTFALVAVVLAAVALLATWLPARRATRVDPLIALRAE